MELVWKQINRVGESYSLEWYVYIIEAGTSWKSKQQPNEKKHAPIDRIKKLVEKYYELEVDGMKDQSSEFICFQVDHDLFLFLLLYLHSVAN